MWSIDPHKRPVKKSRKKLDKSRLRRKYFSTLKYVLVLVLVLSLGIVYLLSQLPRIYYVGFMGVVTFGFLFWALFKLFFKPQKYIDPRGYVVLTKFKELEHRDEGRILLGSRGRTSSGFAFSRCRRAARKSAGRQRRSRQRSIDFHAQTMMRGRCTM